MGGDYKLVQCPYCKETIRSDAIVCKHCKSDLSQQPAPVAPRPQKKSATSPVTIVLSGIVIAAFIIWIYNYINEKSDGPARSMPPSHDQTHVDVDRVAKDAAITIINEQLVSPASSEYLSINVVEQGGGYYLFHAMVDSDNAFGAKLRSSLCAVVEIRDGGQSGTFYHDQKYSVAECTNPPTANEIVGMKAMNSWPSK